MIRAVNEARAAGIPWPLILAAILEGLPALLELIRRWREQAASGEAEAT